MTLVLLIVVPCCLVGVVVYAAMSRWELSSDPGPYRSHGGGYRGPSGPRLTLRETVLDWPIPQFQRLHPAVLVTISAVLAVWILAWIVVFFVGLSMLHA
jgi:hypothetical protein